MRLYFGRSSRFVWGFCCAVVAVMFGVGPNFRGEVELESCSFVRNDGVNTRHSFNNLHMSPLWQTKVQTRQL